MSTSASRSHRLSSVVRLGVALAVSATASTPLAASARPWWSGRSGSADCYGKGYQAYGTPPLTPVQQVQRCNTGRLIGGLGGGAVAYALSRDDGRAWAIPLGALLGSQVGCNAAAGRGPLPW